MSVQSVVRCDSYDPDLMREAVRRHFAALNIGRYIKPGINVLIKPNLVAARKPQTAATTRLEVVRAIAECLRSMGVEHIVLADSPGGLYTAQALDTVYAVTGMRALQDVLELNRGTGYRQRGHFNIIDPVCEADLIVNVAKLKTHSMTRLSAGVKNLFGCVPGLQKPELHYTYPEAGAFAQMLVDLSQIVKPQITVLDAVECMEGDGPTGGTMRRLGLLLASDNMYAQDDFAARLIGMDPGDVIMLRKARAQRLYDLEDVTYVGDEPVYADPPFRLPHAVTVDVAGFLPGWLQKPARFAMDRLLKPLPRLDRDKCVGCGKCAESCPPGIITIREHKAIFVAKGCISCFCCQEMCPAHAISVRRRLRR